MDFPPGHGRLSRDRRHHGITMKLRGRHLIVAEQSALPNTSRNRQQHAQLVCAFCAALRASLGPLESAPSSQPVALPFPPPFVVSGQPLKNVNAPGDPYRTLFVGRLAYETTERKLKREFEEFGAVASVTIVRESAPVGEATGSDGPRLSRGYGFVEFVSEDSLKLAYRRGDGRRIDGRCVVVDVERGRTVPNWLPRRLGGGLGDSRRAAPPRRGKKDGWRRPGVPKAAGILTLDVKRKLAAAQQAAIDASSADASGGAGRLAYDARGGAAAARGGYSAAFDVAVDQLEREAHAASVAAAAAHAPPEPPQMAVDEGAAPSSATAAVPSPAAAEAAP